MSPIPEVSMLAAISTLDPTMESLFNTFTTQETDALRFNADEENEKKIWSPQ